MSRKSTATLVLFLTIVFLSFPESQDYRTALVIGNSAYKTSPLKNPANDARDLSTTLKELGFMVTTLIDANHERMYNAIRDFGKELAKGGVGLFFFSGHGMQVKGVNYLIPVGDDIQSEDEVLFQTVDANLVLSKMESAQNRLNIVILDACRNNPFAKSFRSSSRGLSIMEAPRGSLVVYATAPGSVAADGTGRNGVFTGAFLKYLRSPGLDIELMLRRVRQEVMNETLNAQVPWSSSSLTESFFFVGEEKVAETAAVSSKVVMKQERPWMPDNMVFIDGGTFMMGDTFGDGNDNEKPVHTVTVSPFYMGRNEVTQKEWREVIGTNPSHYKGDNLPVEMVSWYDAVQYCNSLSEMKGLDPCYIISGTRVMCDFTKKGFRLATEAEWEFAARGGTRSKGYKYSGSNSLDSVAWFSVRVAGEHESYYGNAGNTTHSVGQKKPNELGLFDMSGNVLEWCWDMFGVYSSNMQIDPLGALSGGDRVVRGDVVDQEALDNHAVADIAYVSFRLGVAPDIRDGSLGFRVVASVP